MYISYIQVIQSTVGPSIPSSQPQMIVPILGFPISGHPFCFWVLPLAYFYLPESARAHLFPQSVEIHYFCSGPISVDPIRFVRNPK